MYLHRHIYTDGTTDLIIFSNVNFVPLVEIIRERPNVICVTLGLSLEA